MALFVVFLGVVLIASSFVFYRDPEEKNVSEYEKDFRTSLSEVLSVVAVGGYFLVFAGLVVLGRGW